MTGLDLTKDNFFAVQAYSTDGLLSALSQEVLLPANVAAGTTITGISSNVGVPLLVGTPVTWTASATSSTGAVEYKFLLFGQQTGWRVAQDYSNECDVHVDTWLERHRQGIAAGVGPHSGLDGALRSLARGWMRSTSRQSPPR
jgi:hypothetical protein